MALGMSKYLRQKVLNTFLRPRSVYPSVDIYGYTVPFISIDGKDNTSSGGGASNWDTLSGASLVNVKNIEDYQAYPGSGLPPYMEDRQFEPTPVYVMLFGSDPGYDWTYDQAYVQNTKPKILAQMHAAHIRSGNNSNPLFIGNNSFGIWGTIGAPKMVTFHKNKRPRLVTLPDGMGWTVNQIGYFDSQPPLYDDMTFIDGEQFPTGNVNDTPVVFGEIYASNMVDLKFTDCPAATMTHVGIFDALSGGNMLYYGPLKEPVTTTLGQSLVIPARSIRVYCQANDLEYDYESPTDILSPNGSEFFETYAKDNSDSQSTWYIKDPPEGMSSVLQQYLLGVTLCGGSNASAADQGMGTGLFPWFLGVGLDQSSSWIPRPVLWPDGNRDVFCDISGSSTIDHTAVLNIETRLPIVDDYIAPAFFNATGGYPRTLTLYNVRPLQSNVGFSGGGGANYVLWYPMFTFNVPQKKKLRSGAWLHLKPGDLSVTLR